MKFVFKILRHDIIIDISQLELIIQTYALDHETAIFYKKQIKINLKTQFSINLMLKRKSIKK